MKNFGKINLNSGTVIISDPCYDRGTWCAGTLNGVRKGEWNCFFEIYEDVNWGVRNSEIMIVHNDINPDNISKLDVKKIRDEKLKNIDGIESDLIFWELSDIDVGVDSGQAGIFDDVLYPSKGVGNGEYGDKTSFYGKCCNVTLKGDGVGVIDDCGIVSRSGYGDGSYNCFLAKVDYEIVAISIEFISETE